MESPHVNPVVPKKKRGRPKKNLSADATPHCSHSRQSISSSTEITLKKSAGDIVDKREKRMHHSTKNMTNMMKKMAKWQRMNNGKFFLFFEKEDNHGNVQKYVFNGLMSSTGDEEVSRVHQGISHVTRFDLETLLSGNNIRCLNHSYVDLPTEADVEKLFGTSTEKTKCEYLSCDLLATESCFDCKSKLCSSHTKVFKSLTYCFPHFPPIVPTATPLEDLVENVASFVCANYENAAPPSSLQNEENEVAEQIADLSSIPRELLEPLPVDRRSQGDIPPTIVNINPMIFMHLNKYEQAVRNLSRTTLKKM